ncbi:MAG TPA: IS66 family transposase, partial [Streptosporangiaceae bacterium]|nr:IS66 family transposase [Streptosporangiaceae bacterium]
KSLRKRTGRRPGRPKGQPGATMSLTDHPDHVIRHEPGCCARCGAGLGGAPETGMERRQVTEIPPVKAQVTEHQMIERECPCCGERTKADVPDGVTAPVQYGPRASALGTYLWHGQFLSRDRACAALGEMFGCAPSPAALAAQARKIAGLVSPAIAAITAALAGADVAHFDETGFRVAGKLAWVHSASAGKFVLVTVHPKRGKEGMDAAGVLPAFTGIACHDAWKPCDSYDSAAGHALCGAHLLRELIAVTETGSADDVIWAQQAIDALLELKEAAGAARDAGRGTIDPEILDKQSRWFREAADAGIVLNAARHSKLQKKRNALATRMRDRADDYLRFARDLQVAFGNNQSRAGHQDEQAPHQGLRLHALDDRRGGLLRHPLLRRHCRVLQGAASRAEVCSPCLRSSAADGENITVCDRCSANVLPACRGGGVVELCHELAVGGAGSVQVLVAFTELEPQAGGLLLEMGDFLVQGIDVGGRAEPGFAPCLLAERFGKPFFELPGTGVEP